MNNPFDQFDNQEANPFDQFDAEQPQADDPYPDVPRIDAQGKDRSILDSAGGVLESAASIGSGFVSEPIAGLAGIFAEDGAGAQTVEATRDALTYQPRGAAGKEYMQNIGKALQPAAEVFQEGEKFLGDQVYEKTGSPELAAIAYSLPTAVLEALGVKGTSAAKKTAKAQPNIQEQSLLDSGKEFDIPVMTTDISPPETYVGRFMQSLNEKLGALGTGRARADQQIARESAVEGLADNLDIDLESDFAGQVVEGLNKQTAKKLEIAGDMRKEAVASLDKYGEVPLKNTIKEIDRQIARQKNLKERANQEIISKLEDTKSSLQGGDFTQSKNIRTEVINDLIAVRKGEDLARAETYYQPVKSAIDKDLDAFAAANDRQAAAKWKQSNKQFAEELDKTKRTELKRILNSGNATPEVVIPLLRGGKPSQLNRLYSSLDDSGKEAAKRAIIQDALKESKFFEVDANPNPNAFATALNKPNRQQAINVFFKGKDKAEIDGLARLLNSTRRAQDASLALRTGEQLVAPGAAGIGGAAIYSDPLTGFAALTTASGLAKAYESKPFRNLLLKLKNSKKGSKQEKEILELAAAVVAGGSMASKEEQQMK